MENTNGRWAEKLQDFQKDPPSLTLASFSQMAYSAPILFSQYLENIGIILEMDSDTNGQLNNKNLEIFWRTSPPSTLTSIYFSFNLPEILEIILHKVDWKYFLCSAYTKGLKDLCNFRRECDSW